jgi:hypothetical protein
MAAIDQKRFTALGREWTARFDFNAMCEIEERSGRGFMEVASPFLVQLDEEDRKDPAKMLAAAKALRMSDIRLVLNQALQGAHPGTTADETGAIIADVGFEVAMAVVAWAIVKAMAPSSGQGGDAAGGENPPPAKPRSRAKAG